MHIYIHAFKYDDVLFQQFAKESTNCTLTGHTMSWKLTLVQYYPILLAIEDWQQDNKGGPHVAPVRFLHYCRHPQSSGLFEISPFFPGSFVKAFTICRQGAWTLDTLTELVFTASQSEQKLYSASPPFSTPSRSYSWSRSGARARALSLSLSLNFE